MRNADGDNRVGKKGASNRCVFWTSAGEVVLGDLEETRW
jgi:hypothetical protein